MKIRVITNTGESLKPFERKFLHKAELGRFGTTSYTDFGIPVGSEYLVMGMVLGKGTLSYLIDLGGAACSVYPYALFEVIDDKLPANWFFRALKSTDKNYPYQEAIWGYYELVHDPDHYEKLIDHDMETQRIYFRRKIEYEKELDDKC